MKKFFNYLAEGKTGVAFFTAYLFIFMIDGLKVLLLFNTGNGDVFYRLFNLFRENVKGVSGVADPLLSLFGFVGSFYWVIISPLLYLLLISLYGAVVQIILHAMMKPKPKRLSVTLSILFAAAGFFYIVKVIPVVGGLVFSLMFLYVSGSMIAQKNGFNKWRGVLVCMLPFVLAFLFGLSLFFSIIGTASFF